MGGGINSLVRWIRDAIIGRGGDEQVTAESALTYAPVWYAVNKIAGHIALMPLNVHWQQGRQILKPTNHLGYRLLRVRPNSYQTPFIFKQQVQTHALLWGNGRAYIHRQGANTELIPLMPDRTMSYLVEGRKWHATIVERDERIALWIDMMQNPERTIVLPDEDVLHIAGLGYDGIEGKSLITLAARSWGIGIGAERHVASQQKKGYAGGLMLEAPQGAFRTADDAKEFLKTFREQHEGASNAGKVGMLREGVKANVMAMSNQDAQFVEQRKFQRQEAALWFLLEQILGDDSSVSYNSLEQKNLAYLQNCLSRWMQSWEQECEAKLLTPAETAGGFYFKFNDGALLRTDKQATATIISQLIASRVINANEGREMLDMNPYEGGDAYENPAVTPGTGNEQPETEPESEPQQRQTANNRALILTLEELIRTECSRCVQATKNPDKFFDWMDRWYASWQTKLADKIEALGGDREAAVTHCEESRRRLLEASECQPSELPDRVASCVEGWPNRVHALIEGMLTCSK